MSGGVIRHYCVGCGHDIKAEFVERHTAKAGHGPIVNYEPTKAPSVATMSRWSDDCSAKAIDGCRGIEMDGYCEHGLPSWPLKLGVI